MILISDIGNTNITVGLFEGNKKITTWRLTTDTNRTCDEYGILLAGLISGFNRHLKLEGAIVSSVVTTLTEKYINAVKKYLKVEPIDFSYKIDIGIKIFADNQSEVGADRIVNAYAATKFYNVPAIVVDLGTATTFDIVNENNEYIGGIISPGMKIQALTLSKNTSKLPLLEIEESKKLIGQNTKDAILSGVVRGHACMIENLITQCEEELNKKMNIIATGGYSGLISKYMKKKFDFVDEDLTLKGLNLIYHQVNNNSNKLSLQTL